MFKSTPKPKQGILAVLALLLVAAACDLDSHTAALPPDTPQEQPPVAQEGLAFSPDAVYLVGEGHPVYVIVVHVPGLDRPKILDSRISVAFETAEAFDLYIRSMEPHRTIELADPDPPREPAYTYSYQDVVEFNAPLASRRDAEQVVKALKQLQRELGVVQR